MKEIDPMDLVASPGLWANRWLVLTAGTMDDCNMMTVAWGSTGCMWARPFAQVVVRPQRHTKKYMEKGDSFTLCAFPEKYRNALQILGTMSGKNGPKLARTNLTLQASKLVASPAYREADLIIECRKIYFQDMNPDGFVDKVLLQNYESKDYHRIYFGEILRVQGGV